MQGAGGKYWITQKLFPIHKKSCQQEIWALRIYSLHLDVFSIHIVLYTLKGDVGDSKVGKYRKENRKSVR